MQEACLNSLQVFASHNDNWYPTTEMLVLWPYLWKSTAVHGLLFYFKTHRTADAV